MYEALGLWFVFVLIQFPTVLHDTSIAHADLKPEALLFRNDEFVRIVTLSKGEFIERVRMLKFLWVYLCVCVSSYA